MAEGRAGALEDYATAAFSVSGVKQDISLEDWKGGWASIVGGLNGKPTSQQFNMVTYILSALLNQAIPTCLPLRERQTARCLRTILRRNRLWPCWLHTG